MIQKRTNGIEKKRKKKKVQQLNLQQNSKAKSQRKTWQIHLQTKKRETKKRKEKTTRVLRTGASCDWTREAPMGGDARAMEGLKEKSRQPIGEFSLLIQDTCQQGCGTNGTIILST